MLNRFIILLFLALSFQIGNAQIIDTTSVIGLDTSKLASPYPKTKKIEGKKKKKFFLKGILKEPYPSPKKAALLSILLPGAGQAYNKKYWKIPFVYAGVGGLGYAIYWNGDRYRHWRDQYKFRVDGDPDTVDIYTRLQDSVLRNRRDSFFKDYQLSFVGFTIVYLLNGMEAFVDAHLLSFDVDDDLSLELYPRTQLMEDGSTTFSLGMSLHQSKSSIEIHPGFIGL